jgi:hypothetical protein
MERAAIIWPAIRGGYRTDRRAGDLLGRRLVSTPAPAPTDFTVDDVLEVFGLVGRMVSDPFHNSGRLKNV